jgi:hypothetical protein
LELELEIEGIKVLAKVDTGFDGDVIVIKRVFDSNPLRSFSRTQSVYCHLGMLFYFC